MPRINEMKFTRICFRIISSMVHFEITINYHMDKYKNESLAVIKKIENPL